MLDDWQDACKIDQHWKMHNTYDRLNRHGLEKRAERIEMGGKRKIWVDTSHLGSTSSWRALLDRRIQC
jgi:hypothetical protein